MSEQREIWKRVAETASANADAIWCGNLCCWLEPCTPPASWPAPRYDDPAKYGDPERMILEWSHGAESGSYWGERAKDWTSRRAWLEQPPGPCKPKSAAEEAWEAIERLSFQGVSGMDKHSFIQGFECHALTAKSK